MKMKPRSTTLNPRALLYKRFISLEKSVDMRMVYKTNDDNRFWYFDNEDLALYEIESSLIPDTSVIFPVSGAISVLKYKDKCFTYLPSRGWELTQVTVELPTAFFAPYSNIAKYQKNNYYYVGSFVYTHNGTISETTTQYLKGNTIPLSSMSIKTYEDNLDFKKDDLCVIGNRLYSIEEVEHEHKQMPKDFYIHYLTLNSVL